MSRSSSKGPSAAVCCVWAPALVKAHVDLDRAVDRCYRKEPFLNDRARVEYLFALYEKVAAPLVSKQKPNRSV